MKRILLSTVTVALVAFGACLLIGRQECAAVSDSVAAEPVAENLIAADAEVRIDMNPQVDRNPCEDTLSQSKPLLDFPNTAEASTKRTIKVPVTTINYVDRVVEMAAVTPLQQQYSVLMLKRAQRMSEEELTKAIEELEAELKEQDEAADAELQKAVEILNQLQETSSGTPAARRAAEALPVLKGEKKPSVDSGGAVPTYFEK
jgi:hypothetical protein